MSDSTVLKDSARGFVGAAGAVLAFLGAWAWYEAIKALLGGEDPNWLSVKSIIGFALLPAGAVLIRFAVARRPRDH